MAADEVVRHDARDGLLGAVIYEGIVLARQRHWTLGDRDGARHGRDVGVVILILDSIVIRIVARSDIRQHRRDRNAQRVARRQLELRAVADDVRHRRAVVRHRVARVAVFLAVILPSLGIRLDDQRVDIAGDGQGAVSRIDGVVRSLRVRIQRVEEAVGGAAHSRLTAREGVDGTLATHKARLRSQRRGAVHQRRAVVRFRQVIGLERDSTFGDAQGERRIHTAVVRAGGTGDHTHRAEIGDLGDGGREAAAVNAIRQGRGGAAVCGGCRARTLQSGSVVRFRQLHRQRDDQRIARRDGQVAVCHTEGHRREVAVRIGELIGSETHGRGADIRPGCRGRATEGHVSALVQRRAERGVEARHALLGAVIDLRVGVADDRHHRVDRRDGLVAVRHVERHRAEVRVRVGELAGGETHVGGAGIRPGRRGRAVKGHV